MRKLQKGTEIEGRTIDEILFTFNVWYSGWECDDVAWVVRFTDGEKGIIETNHGRAMISGEDVLQTKIKEYEGAIRDTQKAIQILNE